MENDIYHYKDGMGGWTAFQIERKHSRSWNQFCVKLQGHVFKEDYLDFIKSIKECTTQQPLIPA
jgi:hypothetical protein